MREKCDKCHSPITDGKCDCGSWHKTTPEFLTVFEKAILEYNEMDIDHPLSGDHHSGTCLILFKGDHSKCMLAKKFIEKLKEKNDG
jgi:hypothetical protein